MFNVSPIWYSVCSPVMTGPSFGKSVMEMDSVRHKVNWQFNTGIQFSIFGIDFVFLIYGFGIMVLSACVTRKAFKCLICEYVMDRWWQETNRQTNKKNLQTISMRPSPSTEEKFGASADISHRYKPPDLRLNFFSKTLTSFDACSCE